MDRFISKQTIENLAVSFSKGEMMTSDWIIVRGGGDLATGTIHRLHSAGYKVLVLETASPAAIRRQVSFCEAVYNKSACVEGVEARLISDISEATKIHDIGCVPILVDPEGVSISELKPRVVVDAIIAKKNLGTAMSMAPCTIVLGPGFVAGVDVNAVVETSRGHNLGRIIRSGSAKPNTGIPGNIGGFTSERVIHAVAAGVFRCVADIGDIVTKGSTIAYIETTLEKVTVAASIDGILRGLLRDGYSIPEGFKIADIDPRIEELENCFTISDKARCIAGSVLEIVAGEFNR